jgi:hypothetical protein
MLTADQSATEAGAVEDLDEPDQADEADEADEPDEADRLLGGVDEEGINKQQTGVKR